MAAAAPIAAQTPRDWTNGLPARYPDADVIVANPAFAKYKTFNAVIYRHYVGTKWAEGPAWSEQGNYLVWSDIPNNRQMRHLEEDGHVSVFRSPAGYSNGNTFDYQGRASPASTPGAASRATSTTAKSPPSPINTTASRSTRRTTPWCIPTTAASGSPIRPTASWATTKDFRRSTSIRKRSTASTRRTAGRDAHRRYRQAERALLLARLQETLRREHRARRRRSWSGMSTAQAGGPKQFTNFRMSTTAGGWRRGARRRRRQRLGGGQRRTRARRRHIFSPAGQAIGHILLPEICANVCFGGPKRNRLYVRQPVAVLGIREHARGACVVICPAPTCRTTRAARTSRTTAARRS